MLLSSFFSGSHGVGPWVLLLSLLFFHMFSSLHLKTLVWPSFCYPAYVFWARFQSSDLDLTLEVWNSDWGRYYKQWFCLNRHHGHRRNGWRRCNGETRYGQSPRTGWHHSRGRLCPVRISEWSSVNSKVVLEICQFYMFSCWGPYSPGVCRIGVFLMLLLLFLCTISGLFFLRLTSLHIALDIFLSSKIFSSPTIYEY